MKISDFTPGRGISDWPGEKSVPNNISWPMITAEKPRAFNRPFSPALEPEAIASDQHSLHRLMLTLR
jgi:hypothetical protein